MFQTKNFQSRKSSNKFEDYFDCIYIINLPNERDKIKTLTRTFNSKNIKYKIIDGVLIKTDKKYMKYYQRWLYQKNLDNKYMNKFIFDENIYLRKNIDLQNKFKTKSKCWNHWNNIGKHEKKPLYEKTKIKLESQLGNLIAHMNAIKDAIYENYERILILEDDIYIHNNYETLHLSLVDKIKNYDILYFGGIQKKWDNININNKYYNAKDTYGGFAYALKNNIFKILFELMEDLVYPLDKYLIEIQKISKKCFVSYPNIFITDLENGKIHRKRDFLKYAKHFKWKIDNYKIDNYKIPKIE